MAIPGFNKHRRERERGRDEGRKMRKMLLFLFSFFFFNQDGFNNVVKTLVLAQFGSRKVHLTQ